MLGSFLGTLHLRSICLETPPTWLSGSAHALLVLIKRAASWALPSDLAQVTAPSLLSRLSFLLSTYPSRIICILCSLCPFPACQLEGKLGSRDLGLFCAAPALQVWSRAWNAGRAQETFVEWANELKM